MTGAAAHCLHRHHYLLLLLQPRLPARPSGLLPPLRAVPTRRPFSIPSVSHRCYSVPAQVDARASTLSDDEAAPPASVEEAGQSTTAVDVNPPRGTRDFAPEEMRLRNWLFQNFREVSQLMSFEEVDFPVLESEALFIRKAGEEITQQLYNFVDKGGRRVVLRPEITPSLARLIMKQGKSASFPLKWFTIGQCWRYERMTRGRRREHYQWNMDIIGVARVRAEAELISAVVLLFERLGITSVDVGIRVSSRKVLQAVLDKYSIPESLFAKVCVVVDKLNKIPIEEIEKELATLGVSSEAMKGIIQVLSLKSLPKLEEVLGSDVEAVADLRKLFLLAEEYGYSQWLQFDASVVRGLAYYTGIVFEAFDRQAKLRAICGGGRYDKLFSTFGGDDIPACGFGFGDAVIVELLKDKGLLPEPNHTVDDIVFPLDEELEGPASKVAALLRKKGWSVDLVEDKRLKWVFKHAERTKARRLILVGNSEWQQGMVRVKILSTREEYDIKLEELN